MADMELTNGVIEQDDFDDFVTTSRDPDIPNNKIEDKSEFDFYTIVTTNACDFALDVHSEFLFWDEHEWKYNTQSIWNFNSMK